MDDRRWTIDDSSNVERSHFLNVADQEPAGGNDRMVPGLAADRLEPRDLLVPIRRGFDEHHLAVFRQHDYMFPREHDLAVAIAAPLPFLLARVRIEAGEN